MSSTDSLADFLEDSYLDFDYEFPEYAERREDNPTRVPEDCFYNEESSIGPAMLEAVAQIPTTQICSNFAPLSGSWGHSEVNRLADPGLHCHRWREADCSIHNENVPNADPMGAFLNPQQLHYQSAHPRNHDWNYPPASRNEHCVSIGRPRIAKQNAGSSSCGSRNYVDSMPPRACNLPGTLNSLDIVCGRGAPTNYHYGNQLFCKLVEEYQTKYVCANRSNKAEVAMEVLAVVKARGGRFVQRRKAAGRFQWAPIDDKRAYEKVCQALRDGTPKVQRQALER